MSKGSNKKIDTDDGDGKAIKARGSDPVEDTAEKAEGKVKPKKTLITDDEDSKPKKSKFSESSGALEAEAGQSAILSGLKRQAKSSPEAEDIRKMLNESKATKMDIMSHRIKKIYSTATEVSRAADLATVISGL